MSMKFSAVCTLGLLAPLPCAMLFAADRAAAQEQPQQEQLPPTDVWQWSVDANVFFGLNYQHRRFINIREVKREVESQNWLMTMASRTAGRGTLTFRSAFSFEPFTMRAVGSPQLLQTGETFKNRRLIDYQHPHDLFMALGSEYRRPVDDWMVRVGVDLVGAPSIGPPVFMHRPSAAENPQATLGHHNVDATHITHGVVKAGVERGIVGFEVSWFQGREPDEDRIGLDLDVPDSWAARLSWTIGPWSAQVSSAWLNEPEPLEPGDVTRLTASVGYTRTSGDRSTAIFVAWGQNREVFGVFDAYVAEATIRPNAKNAFYGRAEVVDKSILGGGVHIPGVVHRHPESRVGAFTVGYVRDLVVGRYGRLGLGADVTRYRIAENLKFLYGSPRSYHVFLRYRPERSMSGQM